jgi:hypothetical protein
VQTSDIEKSMQRFLRERLADSEAPAANDLLTLVFPELQPFTQDNIADLSERLYILLSDHAVAKLQQFRRRMERNMNAAHPLGMTRTEAQQLLRADMLPKDSSELEMWSALCFRYFSEWQPIEDFLITAKINIAKRTFEKKVEAGLHELAAELRRRERRTRQQAFRTDEVALSERQLQGSRQLQGRVLDALNDPDGVRVIALVGIGGIGKTTQAIALGEKIRETHGLWRGQRWISARQERLTNSGTLERITSANRTLDDLVHQLCIELSLTGWEHLDTAQRIERLGEVLRVQRWFIVFDNLETLEGVQALLKITLSDWKGETRFLITTRELPDDTPGVYVERIAELSKSESQLLIEATAAPSRVLRLTEEDMTQIYRRVGGIPLALKLLASQFTLFPFDQVMAELTRDVSERRTDEKWATNLFDYLYRRTWAALNESGRQFLLGLSEVKPTGASYEWVMAMARGRGLSDSDCREAMETLRRHSLLEVNNTLRDPRYRLHQLTITFLQTIQGTA